MREVPVTFRFGRVSPAIGFPCLICVLYLLIGYAYPCLRPERLVGESTKKKELDVCWDYCMHGQETVSTHEGKHPGGRLYLPSAGIENYPVASRIRDPKKIRDKKCCFCSDWLILCGKKHKHEFFIRFTPLWKSWNSSFKSCLYALFFLSPKMWRRNFKLQVGVS